MLWGHCQPLHPQHLAFPQATPELPAWTCTESLSAQCPDFPCMEPLQLGRTPRQRLSTHHPSQRGGGIHPFSQSPKQNGLSVMTGLYDQIRQYFISVFTAREPGTRGTTGIPEHAVCSPQLTTLPKARSGPPRNGNLSLIRSTLIELGDPTWTSRSEPALKSSWDVVCLLGPVAALFGGTYAPPHPRIYHQLSSPWETNPSPSSLTV